MYEAENYGQLKRSLRRRGLRYDVVRTFADLARLRTEFVAGIRGADGKRHFRDFVLIIGTPGQGKSFTFENDRRVAFTNNQGSAWGFYKWASSLGVINRPICFDDVDGLLRDKATVALIKAIAKDGREEKEVCWRKRINETYDDGSPIPKSFRTRSRICVLANEQPPAGTWNMAAAYERMKVVFFEPTVHEVHRYVGTWWDHDNHGEIYKFIGENLDKITIPSCRWYEDAKNEKNLRNDWVEWLRRQWHGAAEDGDADLAIIAEILREHSTGQAQVAAWRLATRSPGRPKGKSRALFYRKKKRYLEAQGMREPDAQEGIQVDSPSQSTSIPNPAVLPIAPEVARPERQFEPPSRPARPTSSDEDPLAELRQMAVKAMNEGTETAVVNLGRAACTLPLLSPPEWLAELRRRFLTHGSNDSGFMSEVAAKMMDELLPK